MRAVPSTSGMGPNQGRWLHCLAVAFALIVLPPLLAGDSTPDSAARSSDARPTLQRLKHLARLGVDRWHAARQRGRGIKIAVLDSGFRGYRQFLGTALP